MPRATSSRPDSIEQPLRRNQACHRCRKRKLKCDAQSPCAGCIKSHAYAVKQYPSVTPNDIQCVYDDPEEISDTGLKAKITRLEAQIADLITTVSEKDAIIARCTCRLEPGLSIPQSFGIFPVVYPSEGTIGDLYHNPSVDHISPGMATISEFTAAGSTPGPTSPPSPFGLDFQLSCEAWPLNLPSPDVLNHLVEAFFSFMPLANRLLHKPTFMASLKLPPTTAAFPHVAVLHAICASASLYTPIIQEAPGAKNVDGSHTFNSSVLPLRFEEGPRYYPRRYEDTLDEEATTFGEIHLRWAASAMRFALNDGDRLLQLLQTGMICASFCNSSGRTLGTYRWLGTTRLAGSLGIWSAPGFLPLSRLPPDLLVLLSPSDDTIENELRRNVFWMAYSMDRLYTLGTVWPISTIRDEDCSQLMPCRLSDFTSGTFVPMVGRQQIFTPRMLVVHPPLTTDSFSLYIKATILLGQVKTFNIRFKRNHSFMNVDDSEAPLDPRTTPSFQALDTSISAFLPSLPQAFRDPVGLKTGAKVDPVLYLTHLLPHACIIMLHDPHGDVASSICPSARKMLSAARAILDLIYKVCSTSFDLLYLEHAGTFCWFLAGATIIRFLKVAIDAGDAVEASRMKQEISVIKFMLNNLGDRIVVGRQQAVLLEELFNMELGDRQI